MTTEQQQQIAALKYEPGYIILLEVLQEDLKDLERQVDEATTDAELALAAHKWRAARSYLKKLRNLPEEVENQLRDQGVNQLEFDQSLNYGSRIHQYLRSRPPLTGE